MDETFVNMCTDIITDGYRETGDVRAKWVDGTPARTIRKFAVVNRYNLAEEFPALTLRPVSLKLCVDEILWIYQRKSNNIADLNSHIWDAWADEHGSIGKAYGYQLGVVSHYADGDYDQVDRVLKDLRENPSSRRIMTNLYNHADLHEMALAPCAYSVTFSVINGTLNCLLNQRSQDVLTANGWNVMQYAVLMHMFANVARLNVGELVHVIADAHVYDRHVDTVRELITRRQFAAPRLVVTHHDNFYDYTVDDFKLENYEHGEQVRGIEVAI